LPASVRACRLILQNLDTQMISFRRAYTHIRKRVRTPVRIHVRTCTCTYIYRMCDTSRHVTSRRVTCSSSVALRATLVADFLGFPATLFSRCQRAEQITVRSVSAGANAQRTAPTLFRSFHQFSRHTSPRSAAASASCNNAKSKSARFIHTARRPTQSSYAESFVVNNCF